MRVLQTCTHHSSLLLSSLLALIAVVVIFGGSDLWVLFGRSRLVKLKIRRMISTKKGLHLSLHIRFRIKRLIESTLSVLGITLVLNRLFTLSFTLLSGLFLGHLRNGLGRDVNNLLLDLEKITPNRWLR